MPPKVAEMFLPSGPGVKLRAGEVQLTLFKTLNAPARNCSVKRSRILVFFISEKSKLTVPGVRTSGRVRPTLPRKNS